MEEVRLAAMPAKRSATPKMSAESGPRMGASRFPAWARSSTMMPLEKKAVAAMKMMALLMAQPTPMEKMVSMYSVRSFFSMVTGPDRWNCWLWITSEWRNRLCGMMTEPSTLITTVMAPAGRTGVTQPERAAAQSTGTRKISAMKATPMSDTKRTMIFSTRW